MAFEDIICESKEGVARIAINRVKSFNSFRSLTLEELLKAFEDASNDGSIGVIVLSGAGGKSFCSGGDVAEMRDLTPETGRVFLLKLFKVFQQIRCAPKPVIAAVNGYCLGGGNEINMVCDLTLASEKSVFGQVGPTVGSIPVLAGTQFLPRNVRDKKAKEIIFLCQRYTAREAMEMGWVNKVVPDDKFEEEVQAWCDRILEMSPQSLRVAKLSLNFESDQLQPSFTHGIELLASTYGSAELKEGMSAFLEKKKPNFKQFRK
jgi:dihydroxynaphthoic acid synthetase